MQEKSGSSAPRSCSSCTIQSQSLSFRPPRSTCPPAYPMATTHRYRYRYLRLPIARRTTLLVRYIIPLGRNRSAVLRGSTATVRVSRLAGRSDLTCLARKEGCGVNTTALYLYLVSLSLLAVMSCHVNVKQSLHARVALRLTEAADIFLSSTSTSSMPPSPRGGASATAASYLKVHEEGHHAAAAAIPLRKMNPMPESLTALTDDSTHSSACILGYG